MLTTFPARPRSEAETACLCIKCHYDKGAYKSHTGSKLSWKRRRPLVQKAFPESISEEVMIVSTTPRLPSPPPHTSNPSTPILSGTRLPVLRRTRSAMPISSHVTRTASIRSLRKVKSALINSDERGISGYPVASEKSMHSPPINRLSQQPMDEVCHLSPYKQR